MLRRITRWLRQTWADIDELEQRRRLMAEPWREEFLHLGWDGGVHGRLLPPVGFTRLSVTSRGWCPAALADPFQRNSAEGSG